VDTNLAKSSLERAVAWHSAGRLPDAESAYQQALRAQPNHPDALHLLGVLHTQTGRRESSIELLAASLAINSVQPVVHANLGNALVALKRYESALASFDRCLALSPHNALAHYGRGNALLALREPTLALENLERAIAVAPNFAEALNTRGSALTKLKRYEEALASYDRALSIKPNHVSALINRAMTLLDMRNAATALRDFLQAIALAPTSAEAHCGAGAALLKLKRKDEAQKSYENALMHALKSTDQTVRNPAEGLSEPNISDTLLTCGIALAVLNNYQMALTSFRRLKQIDPDHDYASGACLHAQLQLRDWTDYGQPVREVIESIERGRNADYPFSFISVCDSPRHQLACARQYAQQIRVAVERLWNGEKYFHDRIRVAYVSAEFLDHAISYLIAEQLERHDRSRFEVVAISLRNEPASPTGRRVKAAFEQVYEVGERTDLEIAQLMRELEIDIAVDLMGYTGAHCATIFNYRPAPVQISFLGLPATTGAPEIDYLIADRFLVPEDTQVHYSESVVYMPDCFQVSDNRKIIAAKVPTRMEMGLPKSGFVFCSFHSSYKVNPPLFDIWCRLVHAVANSVLWILAADPLNEGHLIREARARGLEPQRLIFARSLPYPEHLARLPLADICLDTLPFNGGATTSDALWMGLPVLTCVGKSFAARMSGSLLHALDLPELVTANLIEYEERALQFAQDPVKLAQLRSTLARNAKKGPLFDTDRYRRHLEAAYVAMVQRSQQNLPPTSIHIAPAQMPPH